MGNWGSGCGCGFGFYNVVYGFRCPLFMEYNRNKDFTTLEAWKKARALRLYIYEEVIPNLPFDEKYNLNTQTRKASTSATANIAEGYGRYHYQEGIQSYRIARGSIFELKDHLISCSDNKFIDVGAFEKGMTLIEEALVTLNGYIRYVQRQKMSNAG